jgi:hypothetical protein
MRADLVLGASAGGQGDESQGEQDPIPSPSDRVHLKNLRVDGASKNRPRLDLWGRTPELEAEQYTEIRNSEVVIPVLYTLKPETALPFRPGDPYLRLGAP